MQQLFEWNKSQKKAVKRVTEQLRTGQLPHALILDGATLKACHDFAQSIAAALLCSAAAHDQFCGTCSNCAKFAAQTHPDAILTTPNDKGVIAVDAIRQLRKRLSLHAYEANTKVVLLHGADTMNPAAQNALLKTLEEPPGPVCFLLVVQRNSLLLPTVRSRCQRLRLSPPDRKQFGQTLAEKGFDSKSLPYIAALATGDLEQAQQLVENNVGDLITALEQMLQAKNDPNLILEIARDIGTERGRADQALMLLELMVRDHLAQRYGAHPTQLYNQDHPDTDCDLTLLVERIQEMRKLHTHHLNRTLAFEHMFLSHRSL